MTSARQFVRDIYAPTHALTGAEADAKANKRAARLRKSHPGDYAAQQVRATLAIIATMPSPRHARAPGKASQG